MCSVGMLFLPNDDALEAQAKAIIDEVVAAEGLKVGAAAAAEWSGKCRCRGDWAVLQLCALLLFADGTGFLASGVKDSAFGGKGVSCWPCATDQPLESSGNSSSADLVAWHAVLCRCWATGRCLLTLLWWGALPRRRSPASGR